MCGIAGFQSRRAHHPPDSLRRITQAMIATLAHRGPDDSGVWIDPEAGLALGHRRLSILDLSAAGRQPMVSSCGPLRHHLQWRDLQFPRVARSSSSSTVTRFRGHSDTEVLLAAIARWGVAEVAARV